MAHQKLLFILPLLLFITSKGSCDSPASVIDYRPVSPSESYLRHVESSVRRVLAPFQLCLACRCCASDDPNNCSSMPCCFGIECNLPGKPYGVCAFVPKTCNCDTCAV
ncbi:hypothetical protein QJS10_CPB21g01755 [Acorus calamus]|uniref:DUF7866 domain-containing protein n=1 Tax=Acorus calamus TaxID=4465 RepID=A0AAV9C2J4_ACOCL|nr:hypothetical protein QJS10_CPB21g01755 [Acorus calamus]